MSLDQIVGHRSRTRHAGWASGIVTVIALVPVVTFFVPRQIP